MKSIKKQIKSKNSKIKLKRDKINHIFYLKNKKNKRFLIMILLKSRRIVVL